MNRPEMHTMFVVSPSTAVKLNQYADHLEAEVARLRELLASGQAVGITAATYLEECGLLDDLNQWLADVRAELDPPKEDK